MWNKFDEDFDVNGTKKIDIIRMQGFMKYAFQLSFYYLAMSKEYELTYKDCLREILSLSGDTDTNACIAGAMIGALLGFKAIDEKMVETVL